MKCILIFLFLIQFLIHGVHAAQKGTLNVPEADVYQSEDFDSEIIDSVKQGESFLISDKTYSDFYKIKLKSGKIGFIPDHEVDVNGKPFQIKPYLIDDEVKSAKKKNLSLKKNLDKAEEEEEIDLAFRSRFRGLSMQLINFHEETMGTVQVDNIYALGIKSISSPFAWDLIGSFQPAKYYAEKTGGSAQGFHLWGSLGFNTMIPINSFSALRYGGSFMGHISRVKVSGATKDYDLQDITTGIIIEGGYLLQVKKVAFDVSAKYFFDRNNYGGLGLSLLF